MIPLADGFPFDARRRRALRQTLSCAAAVLPLSFDALTQCAKAAGRRTLAIAYPVDVPSWDATAATATQMQSLFETVYDSPLRYSPDQRLEARQISAWSWQDAHKTRLAITLRDDIFFHDGSRLTTEDVRWSLSERPKGNAKLAVRGLFNTLDHVEIVSPFQAVLVYRRPTPTAPIYLAFLCGYILPRAYIEKMGNEWLSRPVGAGPYRVVDYQRNSRIVLEAFDRYWGGKPAIERVTFQISPDPAVRVSAVESGRAALGVQLPIREVQRLAMHPALDTRIYPSTEIYLLRIPSGLKPLDDENVRVAMTLSIDRALLSKAFYAGIAPPLGTFATRGSIADDPGMTIPFDPLRASALLAKSGYSPAKPVRLTLLTYNGSFPSDFDLARAIAGMWQKVGIEATVLQTTPAKVVAELHAGKLSGVLLESWANATGDPENFSGRMFDPSLMFSSWKEPILAPRFKALASEVDDSQRLADYREIADEATRKAWAIPLLQAVATLAFQRALQPRVFGNGYVLPAEYDFAS